MIAQLEDVKSHLLWKRGALEKKIDQLHERQKARPDGITGSKN
jgi:hypothetical protein